MVQEGPLQFASQLLETENTGYFGGYRMESPREASSERFEES
jgi:hypothetical protein